MSVAKQTRSRVAECLVCEILVAVRRFADGEVSAPGLLAFAANNGEGNHGPVPHLERFPCGGHDLHDLTHGLMAHDIAGFHAGHEMIVEVQVRAAVGATRNLDDGVPLVLDPGIGYAIRSGCPWCRATGAFIATSAA